MAENQQINTLASRVSSLETDVQNIGRQMDNVVSSINALSIKIDNSSKTNWQTLAAWATIVIIILGGVGKLSIDPVLRRIEIQSNELREHLRSPGHAQMMERSKALAQDYEENKQALKNQDTYLQREMRDLDNGIKGELAAKIEGLDRVLQREMRLLLDKTTEHLRGLENRVNSIQKKQETRTGPVWAQNAKQDEAIKRLSKQIEQVYHLLQTHLKVKHIPH